MRASNLDIYADRNTLVGKRIEHEQFEDTISFQLEDCFLQSRHEDGNKHRNLHGQLGRRLRVRILLRNAFPRGETLNCRERERGRERRFRSVDYSVLDIVFGVTEAMAC